MIKGGFDGLTEPSLERSTWALLRLIAGFTLAGIGFVQTGTIIQILGISESIYLFIFGSLHQCFPTLSRSTSKSTPFRLLSYLKPISGLGVFIHDLRSRFRCV